MKKFFGVSAQAITFRCKDLGIIQTSTYQNLYKEFAMRGWLKPPYGEPEPLQSEETHRFKRLCFRALAEEVISKGKAAELLEISIDQIDIQMNKI